eukprot:gene56857-77922_t
MMDRQQRLFDGSGQPCRERTPDQQRAAQAMARPAVTGLPCSSARNALSVTWRYIGANTRQCWLKRAAWLAATALSSGPTAMSLFGVGSSETVG